MLAQVRKAALAAGGGFLAALVAALAQAATDGTVSADDVSQALGVAVASAVTLGWAVWRVPNAGARR